MTRRLTLALSALLTLALPGQTATLHVSKSGDGSDGFSWATAYTAIGDALAVSATGDLLWVKGETFKENIVVATPITIIGGLTGTELDVPDFPNAKEATLTTIDGDQLGRVILLSAEATLERFILRNGKFRSGSGVFINATTATLRDVVISRCQAIKSSNDPGLGGGVYARDSRVVLSRCIMVNNQAGGRVGNFYYLGHGGAIYAERCDVEMVNCQVHHNLAYHTIFYTMGSLPNITVPSFGGGMYLNEITGNLENVLMYENGASHGGNTVIGVRPPGVNISQMTALGAEGSFRWGGESLRLRNSIFLGSTEIFQNSSRRRPNITHSNIKGGSPGEGNIDADPLFVDPAGGDFRLRYGSPCIDSGTMTETLTDLDGNMRPVDIPGVGTDGPGAFDMGAYEYQFPKSDLNKNGYLEAMDLFIMGSDWMKATGARG